MAGDWIKMQINLGDKPEVIAIASRLNLDVDTVVGKLLRVWGWFDQHTVNGNAVGVTYSFLDRVTCVAGFAEQMALVGWLEENGSTLSIPNFQRHNGKTAKNRALTNERVAKARTKSNDDVTQNVTLSPLQKPLPEKRREDIKDAEPTGSHENAAPQKTEAPLKPADVIWTLGVRLLTEKGASEDAARAFLGKHAKGAESQLAEVIGHLATHPKVDPKAYISKAMQPKTAQVVL
jgi:hypothetical protein